MLDKCRCVSSVNCTVIATIKLKIILSTGLHWMWNTMCQFKNSQSTRKMNEQSINRHLAMGLLFEPTNDCLRHILAELARSLQHSRKELAQRSPHLNWLLEFVATCPAYFMLVDCWYWVLTHDSSYGMLWLVMSHEFIRYDNMTSRNLFNY